MLNAEQAERKCNSLAAAGAGHDAEMARAWRQIAALEEELHLRREQLAGSGAGLEIKPRQGPSAVDLEVRADVMSKTMCESMCAGQTGSG